MHSQNVAVNGADTSIFLHLKGKQLQFRYKTLSLFEHFDTILVAVLLPVKQLY